MKSAAAALSGVQTVWGIDVGEAKLAVAMLYPDGTATSRTLALASKRDPRRFSALERHARLFLLECTKVSDPLAVFVELPVGRFPNPWLTGAWAVICAAAVELDTRYEHPMPIFSIDVRTWKKLAIGNGNAKKAAIEQWARAEGFEGESQDECDAFGVARAGRAMLDRSERWAA